MHNTPIPRIQFTERTNLRRLHFAMIAIRTKDDADTIEVHFKPESVEADSGTHQSPLSEPEKQIAA